MNYDITQHPNYIHDPKEFWEQNFKETTAVYDKFVAECVAQAEEVRATFLDASSKIHAVHLRELLIFRVLETKLRQSTDTTDIIPILDECMTELNKFREQIKADTAAWVDQRKQLLSEPAAGQG